MAFKSEKLATIALVGILAGCTSQIPMPSTNADRPVSETVDTTNADYGQVPANYEELIKRWASANLKDPDSVRYGKISKPRKEYIVVNLKPVFGYSVCAAINAKNSYGGYVGNQTFWFMIREGKIERAQNIDVGFPGKIISRSHNVNCEDGN